MYFPRPEERIKPPEAQPAGVSSPPVGNAGTPAAQQPAQPPAMPVIPNVSGFQNPQTGQQNNFAPIPPDEIKKWAELNHVSKGAIKQVEWSQNTGNYLLTMKDGDIQKIDPQYVMQNQGHWAPHPDHAQAAVHFIAARQMRQNLPMILNALRARQAQGTPTGAGPIGKPMGGRIPAKPAPVTVPTPMTPMAQNALQTPPAATSGL